MKYKIILAIISMLTGYCLASTIEERKQDMRDTLIIRPYGGAVNGGAGLVTPYKGGRVPNRTKHYAPDPEELEELFFTRPVLYMIHLKDPITPILFWPEYAAWNLSGIITRYLFDVKYGATDINNRNDWTRTHAFNGLSGFQLRQFEDKYRYFPILFIIMSFAVILHWQFIRACWAKLTEGEWSAY